MFRLLNGVFTVLGAITAISEVKGFFNKLFSSDNSVKIPSNKSSTMSSITSLFTSQEKEHRRQKELLEIRLKFEKEIIKMEREFDLKMKKVEKEHKSDKLKLERYKEEMFYKYRADFLDKLMGYLRETETRTRRDLKQVEEARISVEQMQGNLLPPPSK